MVAWTFDSVYSTNVLPKPFESTVLIHLQAEAKQLLWLFHGELPFHGPCLAACTFPTAHIVAQLPLTH